MEYMLYTSQFTAEKSDFELFSTSDRSRGLNYLTIQRIQLTRSVDETSFVVAYVKVCG